MKIAPNDLMWLMLLPLAIFMGVVMVVHRNALGFVQIGVCCLLFGMKVSKVLTK